MSDPATRPVSRAELEQLLASEAVPDEAPTRLFRRASPAPAPPAPMTRTFHATRSVVHAKPRRPWQRWLRSGLAVAAAGLALTLLLREREPAVAPVVPSPMKVAATAQAVAAPAITDTVAPVSRPREPCHDEPCRRERAGRERLAADLLLSGRKEEALNVYRELAAGAPVGDVYLLLADTLARELARRCEEAGPCDKS